MISKGKLSIAKERLERHKKRYASMNDETRNNMKRSHLLTAKELVKNLREIEIENMIVERVEGKKGRKSVIN